MQDTLRRVRHFRQYPFVPVALLYVSPRLDTGDAKPYKARIATKSPAVQHWANIANWTSFRRARHTARLDYCSRNMKPRPEAVEVLTQLRAWGRRTGLISSCATEVYVSWKQTPFPHFIEAPVFSCSVGLKRRDPRVYEVAVTELGTKPSSCLHVADGDEGELQGAIKAGMDAVRVRVPYETGTDALRVNEEDWEGLTISSLRQVLDLIDNRSRP